MKRACLAIAALLVTAPASARAPELRPGSGEPVPARLRQSGTGMARVVYRDLDGDRPQEAWLVLEGKGQPRRMPADLARAAKSYRQGVELTWTVGPLPPGRYHAHFAATSIDGRARYPEEGGLEVVVESLLVKWLLLAAGLGLALAVLPGVVFMGARRAADPAGAARTSLAAGLLVAYLWFLWLFVSVFPLPVLGVVGLLMAALTGWVWLNRRRG
jgi:hypothetical protein